MIGAIIQLFHGKLNIDFLRNTFTNNGVLVALAPGDGLMLEKVSYEKYNEFNTNKKNDVMI
jgi:tRNA U38,U39,U40 pseudouridine synthase TruA